MYKQTHRTKRSMTSDGNSIHYFTHSKDPKTQRLSNIHSVCFQYVSVPRENAFLGCPHTSTSLSCVVVYDTKRQSSVSYKGCFGHSLTSVSRLLQIVR